MRGFIRISTNFSSAGRTCRDRPVKRMKIIFLRRDNIGDLICTTPAIRATREAHPHAKIGVLVNTYNADAIMNNPDVDEIYVYEKTKHSPDKNKLSVSLRNVRVFQKIRKERYDVGIGCGSYSRTLERHTFLTGAKMRIGYRKNPSLNFLYNNPVLQSSSEEHEVVKTFNLLKSLEIGGQPGDLVLFPDRLEREKFKTFKKSRIKNAMPLLAIAISARIQKHKWPLEKFTTLIKRILHTGGANILLLWAPGSKDSPAFPGDEESAAHIIRNANSELLLPYPTPALKSLIAALSLSDVVVTLDTGSLHLSAALKKPTVALMTKKNTSLWHPWRTKSVVVTAENRVEEISVESVLEATDTLMKDFCNNARC